MSPTARSLALLRRRGYVVAVAESWIPRLNIRRDLFGCIDLVAVTERETGVLGIQTTTSSNLSSRLKKARQTPALRTWLAAGNRFELHGWRKVGRLWQPRIVAVQPSDLAEVVIEQPQRRKGGRRARQRDLFDSGPISAEIGPQASKLEA